MKRRLSIASIATALALSATLAGCSNSDADSSAAGGQGKGAVKIGLSAPAAMIMLPLFAQDEGFLDAEGLDQADVSFIPGPQLVPAAAGGAVDIAISAAPSGEIIAYQSGKLKMLATWTKGPGQFVVAGPGIDSVEALKGRPVAINGSTAGSNSMLVQYALRQASIGFDEVKVQNLQDASAQVQAFAAGQVDAMVSLPPLSTRAIEDRPGSKVIRDFSDLTFFKGAVIMVNSDWAEENRETAVAFLRAMNSALAAWREDKDAAIASMSKHLDVPAGDPLLESMYSDMDELFTTELDAVTEDDEKQLFGMLRDAGEEDMTDDKAKNVVDESFLDEAKEGR